MSRVTISTFAIPALSDNYIWLLKGATDRVVVVDPGQASPVAQFLQDNHLELAAIVVTHHHHDHTGGISALRKHWEIPVFGPLADNIAQVTVPLQRDETFNLPGLDCSFQALATPGHTRGQANYYGGGMVFTGDTLFSGGCGRLFEGTAETMWISLQKLRALPPETLMYCGHEYTRKNLQFAAAVEPNNEAIRQRQIWAQARVDKGQPTLPSTIANEREFNPFLRADQADVRRAAERYKGTSLGEPDAVFAALREWKDHF